MQGRRVDPQDLRHVPNTLPLGTKAECSVEIEGHPRPTQDGPATSSGCHTCDGAFTDQLPLKLCDPGDHREGETTGRRAGVDAVVHRDEVDLLAPEFVESHDEMADGPCKPIEAPDSYDVELAFVDGGHEPVQLGAPIFRAAHPEVDELSDDLPATLGSELAEAVELKAGRLIGGRDAGVEGNSLGSVSKSHVFDTNEAAAE